MITAQLSTWTYRFSLRSVLRVSHSSDELRTEASAPADDTFDGARPGSPELRRLEVAMLAAGLASFGLMYCTQALLPEIGAAFGIRPAAAALTVALTTGGLALGVLPMSSLAESFGRGRVMRIALIAAALLVLAGAFSGAYWQLLLTRALVGLALAGVVAVAMGHLGDEVSPRVVGSAMGLYVSGNTLGGVLGRLIPAGVHELGSWRLSIGVMAGLGLVATLTFSLLLPAARKFDAKQFRLKVHAAAVGDHLKTPGIRRLCLVALLMMAGFVATYNYLTYRLESAPFDLPASVGGLVFLAYLAGTVTSTLAGRLADRYGRRPVLLASILIALAGLACTLPNQLALVVIGLCIFTGGFFGAHSTASGWVSRQASHSRAQASALYLMAYYLGSSLGGTLIGFAWSGGGWLLTAAVVGVLFILAAVVAAGVRPRGEVQAGAGTSTSSSTKHQPQSSPG